MLFTFKKIVLGVALTAVTSLGLACGAGHWGGGYVHGHPDAYRYHGNFNYNPYPSRVWYGPRYHHHGGRVQCEVVRQCYMHHNFRFCEPVRHCYRVW